MPTRFNLQGIRQSGMSEMSFCDLTGPGSQRRTPASTGKSTAKIQPAAPGSVSPSTRARERRLFGLEISEATGSSGSVPGAPAP